MTEPSKKAAPGKTGVGVIGGSGYIGGELLRYLAVHPRVDLLWACARARAGTPVARLFPNLQGFVSGEFQALESVERDLGGAGAVFVSLPHNQSQEVIPRLAGAHPAVRFIDMGGDFRTNDPAGYRQYYGREHSAPEWLPRFVYGFTEFQRASLKGAKLIANPGCFATSILLALAPLAAGDGLRGPVCLSGITGSSGAGNTPLQTTHHPERGQNVRAYKPLVHQHLIEVEGFLRTLSRQDFRLNFVPQSGPFVRGIFTTLFLPGKNVDEVEEMYRSTYRNEPLISVCRGSPELRWVQGTPRSWLGVAGDRESAVVFVVIDNLGKGAAGQAIQNFNLSLGYPETEGLLIPGGFV